MKNPGADCHVERPVGLRWPSRLHYQVNVEAFSAQTSLSNAVVFFDVAKVADEEAPPPEYAAPGCGWLEGHTAVGGLKYIPPTAKTPLNRSRWSSFCTTYRSARFPTGPGACCVAAAAGRKAAPLRWAQEAHGSRQGLKSVVAPPPPEERPLRSGGLKTWPPYTLNSMPPMLSWRAPVTERRQEGWSCM